jgi:hypothetical protein
MAFSLEIFIPATTIARIKRKPISFTILRKMLEKITSIQEEDGVKPGDIEIEI